MNFYDFFGFFAVILLLIFIVGLLSPFEALGWWAGWYGDDEPQQDLPAPSDKNPGALHFVVYLSGINSASGERFGEREINFLALLQNQLKGSHTALVDDIFPYTVTERPLTGQRVFAWFWRWALRMQIDGRAAGAIINLRNIWQVAVSADHRYGPIYNQGTARMLHNALLRHGYKPGSGVPVTLLGYSGGGQVAVGAAPHLKVMLDSSISVISLGGVLSADPGLLTLEHVFHVQGNRDIVQRLGVVYFPGRWPFIPSPWNKAKEQGILEVITLAQIDHTGPGSYLDDDHKLADGHTRAEHTVHTLSAIILREEAHLKQLYEPAISL